MIPVRLYDLLLAYVGLGPHTLTVKPMDNDQLTKPQTPPSGWWEDTQWERTRSRGELPKSQLRIKSRN